MKDATCYDDDFVLDAKLTGPRSYLVDGWEELFANGFNALLGLVSHGSVHV